jgi:outer membrane biosynthesis protein TonB
MKHLIFTGLLIILTGTLFAQTETQTKRPSWSQGLPERQTNLQPGKPGFESEQNKRAVQSQPDITAERPSTPQIEIDLSTQPDMEFNVKPEAIEQLETEPVRRAGIRRLNNKSMDDKDINPLHQQYNWSVVKTEPINIPPRFATKNQLKVRIYINPDGQVVRVAAGSPDVPALMLKEAQHSIQQWQFEPPKDIGITDNLSKTFTIDIETG